LNNSFDFSTAGKYVLPSELARARFAMINGAIERKRPLPLQEAVELIDAQNLDGNRLLKQLLRDNIIGGNKEGEVCYLYPLSMVETEHRVRLADGREFNAMCAMDSLGCAATFDMPVEVFSYCRDSGEAVYAKISSEKLEVINPSPSLYVSYYDCWLEGTFNF